MIKKQRKSLQMFATIVVCICLAMSNFLMPSKTFAETADTTPPETPTGLRLEQRDGTNLRLNWNWTKDEGGYVSQWELSYAGRTLLLNHNYPGETVNVAGLDLSSGKSYMFGLRAIDTSGNKSAQTQWVFETTPPTSPGNVRLISYDSYGNPDVIKFDSANDNAGQIRGYEVFLNGQSIGMTTGPDYLHQFSLMEQIVVVACTSTPRGSATVQLRAIDSSFNIGQLSAPLSVVFPN